MKKIITALFAAAFVLPAVAEEKGFTSLFDGKTLKGWDGKPVATGGHQLSFELVVQRQE